MTTPPILGQRKPSRAISGLKTNSSLETHRSTTNTILLSIKYPLFVCPTTVLAKGETIFCPWTRLPKSIIRLNWLLTSRSPRTSSLLGLKWNQILQRTFLKTPFLRAQLKRRLTFIILMPTSRRLCSPTLLIMASTRTLCLLSEIITMPPIATTLLKTASKSAVKAPHTKTKHGTKTPSGKRTSMRRLTRA